MKKKIVVTTEKHEVWVIRQPLETDIPEADHYPTPPIQESFLVIRKDEDEDLTTENK